MSTTINQDVIKAREVVAGYKELNKGTIEQVSYYDPILKLRRYKKVSIDPNSKDFVKLYGKKKNEPKEKKDIPIKKAKIITKTIKKASAPRKKTKRKYTPRPDKTPDSYDPNNLTSKVYALHLEGIRNDLIAEKMDISIKRVRQLVSVRRNQLGVKEDARCNSTYKDVKTLFQEGKSVTEIAYLVNVSVKNVYNLLIRVKKELKADLHHKEIKEVLEVINSKMKLNQVDHCFASWITPQKVKYKTNINKLEVVAICKELVEKGELKEITPDKKYLGKMFKFIA